MFGKPSAIPRTGSIPFNWGLRSVEFDREAIANYSAVLRSCEARFKDGTKLSIPADGTVDPVGAEGRAGELGLGHGLPGGAHAPGRPGQRRGGPDRQRPALLGRRAGDQRREHRERGASRSRSAGSAPGCSCRPRTTPATRSSPWPGSSARPSSKRRRSFDVDYVPPLLVLDAWPPLWQAVQSLYHQIGAKVDQLAAQIVDRSISFDSQVPGDAERLLKLAVLNGALSAFESIAFVRGLTPLVRLSRALPAGRPARDLHRRPDGPRPPPVRPRGPRRLLLHGDQVDPARARYDRPVGVREALLRAQRRTAPGQPGTRLA